MRATLTTLVVFCSNLSLHGAFSPDVSGVHPSLQHSNLFHKQHRLRHDDLKKRTMHTRATRRSLQHSLATSFSSFASTSEWMPLYLSCLAGASTCLGAAIVFMNPNISSNTMSFSLALAGSVMITVSVVSLGPECLQDPAFQQQYRILPLFSLMFLERLVSFTLGCLSYRLLSYFTFPEPEELIAIGLEEICWWW